MRIEAFIFDLDGVIVNTAVHHFHSWRLLSAELGFEIPDKLNEKLKGLSRMEALEEVLAFAPAGIELGDYAQLADKKNNMYRTAIQDLDSDEILPGFMDFMREAKSRGFRVAVGSGSKNATIILQRLGIYDAFDAICDGNDISRSKPDPEVFLCVCRKLGVPPTATVIFEDAMVGIEAAQRMGAMVVGVGDADELSTADVLISGFSGLQMEELITRLTGTV
jgi:beta-phosphoglucomutase